MSLSELSEISTSDRVLLVGPDQEMLELLEEVIREAGMDVVRYANDDDEAFIKTVRDGDFHVVVCDEVRERRNAMKLYRELDSAIGRQRSSFLLVADDAHGDRIAKCLTAGVDEYVIKPFDVDELIARIHKAARLYRNRLQLLKHETGDEIVGFSGDLDYLNLPDILMNLHQNVQTGKLYVEVEEGEYIYSFDDGELLAVRGPRGLQGRKAFYRAMRESQGTFRFIVFDELKERGDADFENVTNHILTAAQEADEFPLARENLPPDPVPVKLTGKVESYRLDEPTAIQPLLEGLIQSTTIDILIHACPKSDLAAAQELEELMEAGVLVAADEGVGAVG